VGGFVKPAAILVEGFSFKVGAKDILSGISFAVEEGSFVSVIGPNGAGKTTLLKCLNRILPGGEGRVEIFGVPLERLRRKELARRLSYVPQGEGRRVEFTVYEFVLMGRYPHLSPFSVLTEKDHAAVERALTATGAAEFSDRRLSTLSGGESQKALIAAALAQQAAVLLLDEPTTFLDYKRRVEILALLGKLNREEGLTVVAVTHDLSDFVFASDRVLALRGGRLVFSGKPGELVRGGVLEEIYDTGFRFVKHPETGEPVPLPSRRTER